MTALASLEEGYRAWVFGASGGLGGAFVRRLLQDPRCAGVHAGARSSLAPSEKVTCFQFDLQDETSIAAAMDDARRTGAPDLVLVCTGVLHEAAGMQPEKTLRALNSSALARAYAINAIGPALIAKHALPLLPRDRKSVFAALSARVGSISDNRAGGWHAYRASKAALNMLIRTCAIELAARNKQAVCVTLHPGTVETALSAPFRSSVRAGQLFSADESAAHLLSVIDALSPAQSGGLFAWDGAPIPF